MVARSPVCIQCPRSIVQIAHYKIPRYIKFVDAFPMTVTGKVQKAKYGEELCAWIKLKSGVAATPVEIQEFCKER
jgi:acyl-CoA synthetase (AMP-forming)/AMP-acid ligase II